MAGTKQPIATRSAQMNSAWMRYNRRLDRGDFSLEANTETTPEPGFFFLLRNGSVLLQSLDYALVEAGYHPLCREYWEAQLQSDTPAYRLASAWGLLGLEPTHRTAATVIETDGTPADRARLLRNRNRQRYLRRPQTNQSAR